MPGIPEFTRQVGGQAGATVGQSNAGALETDNYREGGTVEIGNGTNTYPHTVDPSELIEELVITETGTEIRADMTTSSGTTLNGVPLRGATLASNFLELDSVTFKDPNDTGAATFGFWAGE